MLRLPLRAFPNLPSTLTAVTESERMFKQASRDSQRRNRALNQCFDALDRDASG